MRSIIGVILMAGLILLRIPSTARAHGVVPEEMAPLKPGRVISVMESDFLVPGGFRALPGPMFYLDHAKELKLSLQQKKDIMAVAHRIMPETIREGAEIDRLKQQVERLSDIRSPFREKLLHRLLREIGTREAEADLSHIKAHRACLHLLRHSQRTILYSFLGHR